ncbi:hypothetical protein PoB_001154900 [Plakobranchus ocellatus]|uniref:Uncharacterized protein n=1 Tax=Plakobranchus ocellatus TaxID=259542 RepID=A0AAV3YSV6_9GAST|nr:hypothetical protein PoB_001154900 [Plakobranchus ocellatus]
MAISRCQYHQRNFRDSRGVIDRQSLVGIGCSPLSCSDGPLASPLLCAVALSRPCMWSAMRGQKLHASSRHFESCFSPVVRTDVRQDQSHGKGDVI